MSLRQRKPRRPLKSCCMHMLKPDFDSQLSIGLPLMHDKRDAPRTGFAQVHHFAYARERRLGRQEGGGPSALRKEALLVVWNAEVHTDRYLVKVDSGGTGAFGHFSLDECLQGFEHGCDEKLTARFHRCHLAISTPHDGVARRNLGAARARGRRLPASVECGQLMTVSGVQLPRQLGRHPP